jgi:hypothetical protein
VRAGIVYAERVEDLVSAPTLVFDKKTWGEKSSKCVLEK